MRRILVYEYTCSGGLLSEEHSHDAASLTHEGWAMLYALATDLASSANVHVQVLADHRGLPGPLPDCELIAVDSPTAERAMLAERAARADWTIVIAPETDRALYNRCQWVEKARGRLLGTSSPLVELLGDKHRTAEHLRTHGVPCPSGAVWRPGNFDIRRSGPLVVKPLDGAGSQATYLLTEQQALDALLIELANRHGRQRSWRIETFEEGRPVSVLALCGPAGLLLLPPCYQRIKFGAAITYHGGAYPVHDRGGKRATRLARRALESLPNLLGYVGIDMILGDDPEGREDYVIEINPRLTTSYVGLRAAAQTNLAQAMLAVVAGNPPDLSFDAAPLEFDADGTVRRILECDPGAPGSSLSSTIDHLHNSDLPANSPASEIQSGDKSPHSKS